MQDIFVVQVAFNYSIAVPLCSTLVNVSRMSPKLVRTSPHILENQEITMAPLFLILIHIIKKSYPVNLKFTSLPLSKPKWQFFSGAVS